MKKTLILIFLFVVTSSFANKGHEFYLSVTEIEYNAESKSVQVISRVFIDDFEDVLSKRYQKDISLSYKKDLETHSNLIQRYLDQKLQVTVDGKKIGLKLLGSKFDADQIILYIESGEVRNFDKVEIENLILTDLLDAQKNIVHVKKGEVIESLLLRKGNSSGTILF